MSEQVKYPYFLPMTVKKSSGQRDCPAVHGDAHYFANSLNEYVREPLLILKNVLYRLKF